MIHLIKTGTQVTYLKQIIKSGYGHTIGLAERTYPVVTAAPMGSLLWDFCKK